MNEARIQISIRGDVINLVGVLTHNTINAVYQNTPAFTEPDYQIDLQEVEKVDSAALALFVNWNNRAIRSSSSLHFTHIPDKLRDIAQLANLERIFD